MDIGYILLFVALGVVGAIVQKRINSKKARSKTTDLKEKMIGNRLRIILESAIIIEQTKEFGTFRSRINVLLDNIQDILNFYSREFTGYVGYYYKLQEICEAQLNKRKGAMEIIIASRTSLKCPYCNYVFETIPSRKRKCPECKETIYRLREEGDIFLITEAEHEIINPSIEGQDKNIEVEFIRLLEDRFRQYSQYYEHIDLSSYQNRAEEYEE